jgi:hypothetical protein
MCINDVHKNSCMTYFPIPKNATKCDNMRQSATICDKVRQNATSLGRFCVSFVSRNHPRLRLGLSSGRCARSVGARDPRGQAMSHGVAQRSLSSIHHSGSFGLRPSLTNRVLSPPLLCGALVAGPDAQKLAGTTLKSCRIIANVPDTNFDRRMTSREESNPLLRVRS